jgi:ATP-binding cassette, subfamily C (CFTR/MRP), member 1
VGSGKSALLEVLLGRVAKSQGRVEIRDSVADVAQIPWILDGGIRGNILFGLELNLKFYDIVLEACTLKDDLATLTNGDETHMGGQGMNLNGSQKVRMALAQAIYARVDIYFLDDVLSAVDMHVKAHLICNVLEPQGPLRDATRILTTNTLSILKQSDQIVMLESGSIVDLGSFNDIRADEGLITRSLQAHTWSIEDEDSNTIEEHLRLSSIVSNDIASAKLATKQQKRRKIARMWRKYLQ